MQTWSSPSAIATLETLSTNVCSATLVDSAPLLVYVFGNVASSGLVPLYYESRTATTSRITWRKFCISCSRYGRKTLHTHRKAHWEKHWQRCSHNKRKCKARNFNIPYRRDYRLETRGRGGPGGASCNQTLSARSIDWGRAVHAVGKLEFGQYAPIIRWRGTYWRDL